MIQATNEVVLRQE